MKNIYPAIQSRPFAQKLLFMNGNKITCLSNTWRFSVKKCSTMIVWLLLLGGSSKEPPISVLHLKILTQEKIPSEYVLRPGETTDITLTENDTLIVSLATNIETPPESHVIVLESGVHSASFPFTFKSGTLTFSFTPKTLRRLHGHSGVYSLKAMLAWRNNEPIFWNIARVNFLSDGTEDAAYVSDEDDDSRMGVVLAVATGVVFVASAAALCSGNCGYFPHTLADAGVSLCFVGSLGVFLVLLFYLGRVVTNVQLAMFVVVSIPVLGLLLRQALTVRTKMTKTG